MLKIQSAEEFKKVLKENQFVLVDFYADWCGPCKMMGPVVERFDNEINGKVMVAKINIDENLDLAQEYRITSIPTLLFFKEGALVDSAIGYRSFDNLMDFYNKHNQ